MRSSSDLAVALAAIVSTVACGAKSPAPAAAPPPAAPPPAAVTAAPAPPPASEDQVFEALAERFVARDLELDPVNATTSGDHHHDGQWPDLSVAGDRARTAAYAEISAALATIPRDELSAQHQIDAQILINLIAYNMFALAELRPAERDPMTYTRVIGEGLDPLLNRTFQTKAERMASLRARLDGIPALVAVAKQRLAHPSKIATETAIAQNAGLIALCEHDLAAQLEGVADRAAIEQAAARAATSLHEFQTFLEKDLLARADGSFRLGRALFERKLRLVLDDDVDIDALADAARAAIAQTQLDMVDTAKQIWTADKLGKLPALDTPAARHAFVRKVLDHVAADRPTNQTILADAKRWLDQATAFVRERDLVRVPDEPVAVVEMPEYRRGVSVAYCDSSGPLEAKPETSYAISPTPHDWPAKRVESFYREYNEAMLGELSVHEAMPGHYLQLMHNNRFPSKLRAVYQSGAFVEGWAVYGEWLMAERGFGGPRYKLQRQKMLLRAAANTVLDHDIHAGTMDEKAAIALMTDQAFQEEGEAVGKWKRARLTSAQLSTYFYGFRELAAIRKANESKPGFTDRAYHDRLLSYGSPGLRYVRELMK